MQPSELQHTSQLSLEAVVDATLADLGMILVQVLVQAASENGWLYLDFLFVCRKNEKVDYKLPTESFLSLLEVGTIKHHKWISRAFLEIWTGEHNCSYILEWRPVLLYPRKFVLFYPVFSSFCRPSHGAVREEGDISIDSQIGWINPVDHCVTDVTAR